MSYSLEKKTTQAFSPRSPGSVLLQGDVLSMVYNKYKSTKVAPKGAIKFNLIFAHGTGMNKAIWSYHIKKLYEKNNRKFFLDAVISVDGVGHGDSAVVNEGKLGWLTKWDDHGRDINQVVQHEQNTTGDFYPQFDTRNILIGHSFGGFATIIAGVLQPSYYDSIIAIEPVIYATAEQLEVLGPRLSKVGKVIVEDFESQEQLEEYFSKYHFFKNFHPEVLKDFIADESIERVKENGDKVVSVKCTKFNQMSCYLSAVMCIPFGMASLLTLTVPIVHIIGKDARWNPPDAIPFIRESIQEDLLTALDLPGEHLLNVEYPDTTVDVIWDHLVRRTVFVKENWEEQPEVVHKRERDVIRDEQYKLLMGSDLTEVSGFRVLAKF